MQRKSTRYGSSERKKERRILCMLVADKKLGAPAWKRSTSYRKERREWCEAAKRSWKRKCTKLRRLRSENMNYYQKPKLNFLSY